MNCDDVQLSLSTCARPLDAGAEAHLAGCEACRAFEADAAAVLGFATLPELSAAEKAKLATLPVSALAAWRAGDRRRGAAREVGRLAIAAGVGALIASAVWLSARPANSVEVVALAPFDGARDLPAAELDFPDDEVFSEVSWPSETEGDLP